MPNVLKTASVVCLVLAVLLAGCRDAEEVAAPGPEEITPTTECALDGMIVKNYSGPKAQVHYQDGRVEFYCETREVFHVYVEPGRKARIAAVYVQDASRVDWEDPEGGWMDAREAFFVVGSEKTGAMGPTFAPFAGKDEAERFSGEYGGEVLTFDEVARKVEEGELR